MVNNNNNNSVKGKKFNKKNQTLRIYLKGLLKIKIKKKKIERCGQELATWVA